MRTRESRCGRLHFLAQKTSDFSKLMTRKRGGIVPARSFFGQGGEVNFFCAILYGRPLWTAGRPYRTSMQNREKLTVQNREKMNFVWTSFMDGPYRTSIQNREKLTLLSAKCPYWLNPFPHVRTDTPKFQIIRCFCTKKSRRPAFEESLFSLVRKISELDNPP